MIHSGLFANRAVALVMLKNSEDKEVTNFFVGHTKALQRENQDAVNFIDMMKEEEPIARSLTYRCSICHLLL